MGVAGLRALPLNLLERLDLVVREVGGDRYLHDGDEAPARGGAQTRHSQPLELDALSILTAGRHLHDHVVVGEDAIDPHGSAQHCVDCVHLHRTEEVVSLAFEALVLEDLDGHHQVARRVAAHARLAVALHANGLPGVDARRNVDLDLLVGGSATLALTGLAGVVDHAARAVAHGAGGLALHLTEDGALHLGHATRAAAAVAGLLVAALDDAGAPAVVTRREPVVCDGLGAARRGLRERDPQRDAHVAATSPRRPAGPATAAPKEGVEDVAYAAEPTAAEDVGHVHVVGAEAARAVGIAELVVVGPLALVREHRVGLVDLLEPCLCIRLLVYVGVQRARQLEKRALDRSLVGIARDAEHLVVIPLRIQPLTSETNLGLAFAHSWAVCPQGY